MPALPPDHDDMKQPLLANAVAPADSPPAYEPYTDVEHTPKPIAPQPPTVVQRVESAPGPSYVMQPSFIPQPSFMPQPTVYNYINPATGERVVSLLPPDHPEMVCLQSGGHEPETHYGLLGILAAIFWFPLGVACCLMDRQVRCRRCGQIIENGPCA